MADFEASSQLLRDNVKWRGGMSVEDRRQRLQSAVSTRGTFNPAVEVPSGPITHMYGCLESVMYSLCI
jgi:hypothetical protein